MRHVFSLFYLMFLLAACSNEYTAKMRELARDPAGEIACQKLKSRAQYDNAAREHMAANPQCRY